MFSRIVGEYGLSYANLFRSSQSKCLYNTPRTTQWSYSLKHDPPGQKIDADEQCQLSFGPESTFCEVCYKKNLIACFQGFYTKEKGFHRQRTPIQV